MILSTGVTVDQLNAAIAAIPEQLTDEDVKAIVNQSKIVAP